MSQTGTSPGTRQPRMDPLVNTETTLNSSVQNNANLTSIRIGSSMDQDGKFIDQWPQFSRPSGVYIDKNDILYVADSESMSVSRNHDGWKRGIRIGSTKDGKVTAFIPDPDEKATGTSAAEGVVVDSMGNVYGAEVGPKAVKKYSKK